MIQGPMTRKCALRIIAEVNAIGGWKTMRERCEAAGYTREQVLCAEDYLRAHPARTPARSDRK